GVGTTMFYVLGSVMMIGAAVLLVTKKKMANEQ
ncbi:MAG: LPXTG cell wall anchor domain-containing protein, partial [Clostridia bacterium]|nr:LPXTG cell wall anchor domain-containing protein [Clostridia bacterium]